ncbi:MAG: S8 family serine peptidase, partial [Anaerolineae bacterium]
TIAIMDSGVDWRHPDLQPNYRGNLGGGAVNHAGNWFDPVYPSITEPTDSLGHGTHVAGTAVGQHGIGTAPGAKWIAVAIADSLGFIYDSDIHRGFEWLMAPDGDPSLAPDVVNNSWGGNPNSTALEKEITALQEAGIITVFSAGNSGPFTGTIESPANLTNTISVAASDKLNEAAWFSSRGPSRVTNVQNPWIAAPGTEILSALPLGRYGVNQGTSMAAPHATGVIGLLLSANPALTRSEIADILAETAVPLAPPRPNNDTGWGLLDAYAAVRTQVETGIVQGLVHSDDQPLPGTAVTITTGSGANLRFETDENGRYLAYLRPDSYLVSSARFGYDAVSAAVQITGHQTVTLDLDLPQQPYGTISGTVQSTDGQPLTATITVLDTPVQVTTDGNGRFQLDLPPNQYKLTAETSGHQLGRSTLLVQTGQITRQAFTLSLTPTILLVDSVPGQSDRPQLQLRYLGYPRPLLRHSHSG